MISPQPADLQDYLEIVAKRISIQPGNPGYSVTWIFHGWASPTGTRNMDILPADGKPEAVPMGETAAVNH